MILLVKCHVGAVRPEICEVVVGVALAGVAVVKGHEVAAENII